MGLQEIILHTLFESGVSEVQDLERYIADDVERYGTRLADNETKLVRAYRDRVSVPLQCLGVLLTWVSRSPPPTASSSTSSTRGGTAQPGTNVDRRTRSFFDPEDASPALLGPACPCSYPLSDRGMRCPTV